MSGLVVTDVDVRVADRAILAGAALDAPAGRVTGLLGPNGAGKSTLLSAMIGLRRLAAGSVVFNGRDLPFMRPDERARICAYVEQVVTTSERLTVRDVVALGRVPFQSAWQTVPSAEDEALVTAALGELGMARFATRLFHSLSGGEQQRVQIARALAQQPQLLLLDEPTSHLDIQAQILVLETIRRRAAAGCTVVLAMHDLNLAARYCDDVVVLAGGRTVRQGRPADVLDAEMLREVYGVHAGVVRLEGSAHPHVVYNGAVPYDCASNPIDNGGRPAKI